MGEKVKEAINGVPPWVQALIMAGGVVWGAFELRINPLEHRINKLEELQTLSSKEILMEIKNLPERFDDRYVLRRELKNSQN